MLLAGYIDDLLLLPGSWSKILEQPHPSDQVVCLTNSFHILTKTSLLLFSLFSSDFQLCLSVNRITYLWLFLIMFLSLLEILALVLLLCNFYNYVFLIVVSIVVQHFCQCLLCLDVWNKWTALDLNSKLQT